MIPQGWNCEKTVNRIERLDRTMVSQKAISNTNEIKQNRTKLQASR